MNVNFRTLYPVCSTLTHISDGETRRLSDKVIYYETGSFPGEPVGNIEGTEMSSDPLTKSEDKLDRGNRGIQSYSPSL